MEVVSQESFPAICLMLSFLAVLLCTSNLLSYKNNYRWHFVFSNIVLLLLHFRCIIIFTHTDIILSICCMLGFLAVLLCTIFFHTNNNCYKWHFLFYCCILDAFFHIHIYRYRYNFYICDMLGLLAVPVLLCTTNIP